MEKIEFPKKNSKKDFSPKIKAGSAEGAGGQSKVPGLSNKAVAVIKFFLGIFLLPFVYTFTKAFLSEIKLIDVSLQRYLWDGILVFLLVHLFVFEPAKIYQKGQKILEVIFHFFSPLVKVAPYVLPVYTIIAFFLYLLLTLFIKSGELLNYFIFTFGFSLALHIVFSAKTLRSKQDFLKANYIFGFSLVFIINLILVGLFLNLIFDKFSFVNFFSNAYLEATSIFKAVFKQLFR